MRENTSYCETLVCLTPIPITHHRILDIPVMAVASLVVWSSVQPARQVGGRLVAYVPLAVNPDAAGVSKVHVYSVVPVCPSSD